MLNLAIILKKHEGNIKNENVIMKLYLVHVDKKDICTSTEITIWIFSLHYLMWSITRIEFHMLKHSWHSRDKSLLVMVYNPFNMLLNSVC